MWTLHSPDGSVEVVHYLEIRDTIATSWNRSRKHLEYRDECMHLEGGALTVHGDTLHRVRKNGRVFTYSRRPNPFTSTGGPSFHSSSSSSFLTSSEDIGSLAYPESLLDGYWVPCCGRSGPTEFHTLEIEADFVSVWKGMQRELEMADGTLFMEDCRLYLQNELLWRVSSCQERVCYKRFPDTGTQAQASFQDVESLADEFGDPQAQLHDDVACLAELAGSTADVSEAEQSEFDGHWVLYQGRADAWLSSMEIDGDQVIDGTGGMCCLKRRGGKVVFEGGVLSIENDRLIRVGKSGRKQLYRRAD
jgi:hypothetical protein